MLGLLTLVAVSGCGGSDSAAVPDTSSGAANTDAFPAAASPGGVYRVGVEESFNFTDGFDPTGEYSLDAFSLYSSLLVRGLLGYRHVAGVAGSELRLEIGKPRPLPAHGQLHEIVRPQGGRHQRRHRQPGAAPVAVERRRGERARDPDRTELPCRGVRDHGALQGGRVQAGAERRAASRGPGARAPRSLPEALEEAERVSDPPIEPQARV